MTEELDKKLCAKYPKIFANRFGDMRTTCMYWGFDISEGWYTIVDKLCSNLQWDIDHNNKDYVIENKKLRYFIPFISKIIDKIPGRYDFEKKSFNLLGNIRSYLRSNISKWRSELNFIYIESNRYPQIVASQVKEKFGGLCFYVESASENQYAVIHFVESLSHQVCEICGSMKNVGHTRGWIYTRCLECAKKENLINETDSSWKSNESLEKEAKNET